MVEIVVVSWSFLSFVGHYSMKVMTIQSGHSFSTSDVYDGLVAGLAINGVEVVQFQWEKPLRIMSTLIGAGIQVCGVPPSQAEHLRSFTSWLAAADAFNLAWDQEVDAVIVVNGILFPPSRAKQLQALNIPVVCLGTEAPYFLEVEQQLAQAYTHWFTNEKKCVGMFGDGPQFYLPHAYNPAVHVPGEIDPAKACDVAFIGGGYPERKALLGGVDWAGVHLETHGTLWHLDLEAEKGATDIGRASRYSDGAIPNADTSAWHRGAKVALNLHRKMMHVENGSEIAIGSAISLGPRAYEIPAVGGFMLCDDERPELRDVYGDCAATFRAWDSDSLQKELRWWLSHDSYREEWAAAQHAAVLPHHWGNRAKYVLEHIID